MHDANDNYAVVTRRVIIHHSMTVSYVNAAYETTCSLTVPRGSHLGFCHAFPSPENSKNNKMKKGKSEKCKHQNLYSFLRITIKRTEPFIRSWKFSVRLSTFRWRRRTFSTARPLPPVTYQSVWTQTPLPLPPPPVTFPSSSFPRFYEIASIQLGLWNNGSEKQRQRQFMRLRVLLLLWIVLTQGLFTGIHPMRNRTLLRLHRHLHLHRLTLIMILRELGAREAVQWRLLSSLTRKYPSGKRFYQNYCVL